jgi:hypothetical protein
MAHSREGSFGLSKSVIGERADYALRLIDRAHTAGPFGFSGGADNLVKKLD